jgi:hypothetical protein
VNGPTTVVASAARTTTGQSSAIVDHWIETAATSVIKNFPVLSDVYRIVWTIAGTTPSFTFSVTEFSA